MERERERKGGGGFCTNIIKINMYLNKRDWLDI